MGRTAEQWREEARRQRGWNLMHAKLRKECPLAFDRQSYAKGVQRAEAEADQRALFTIAELLAQLVKGSPLKLVNITTEIAVNPEQVSEVSADYEKQTLLVKMIDGTQHNVKPAWGSSMADSYTNLVKKLQGLE